MISKLKMTAICMIFMISIVCITNVSAETITGECGESATYSLNENVLTISGTGTVDDDIGWADYFETIDTLIVSEGITELDARLFEGFDILSTVTLPNTLTTIGARTFRNCSAIGNIIIPDSVETISTNSFSGCDSIVFLCSAGSYAEQFAKDNDITYKIIGQVTITFDANGGSGAPEAITKSMVDKFSIPNISPFKAEHIFMGWATTNNAANVEYKTGDEFTISEDITLFAVWLKCSITSDTTENMIYINSSMAVPDLTIYEVAYKENRLIDVLVKRVNLISGINSFEMTPTWTQSEQDNVKVFIWDDNLMPYTYSYTVPVIKTYTVQFVDWNNNILDTQNVVEGTNAVVPSSPTRDGYTFCGWSCSGENITQDTTIVAQYIDATKENVFKVSDIQGKVGDVVTTSIYLDGIVKTCGFDMRLNYDSDVLEFVGSNVDWNLDIVAHHVENESLIKFNYGSSKNRTKKAKIIEVSFRIKDTNVTETTLGIQQVEVIAADETNNDEPIKVNHTLIDGVVKIK